MGKGTSSLYSRAVVGFLFKDWLLLQRSGSVNIKIRCARNFVFVLRRHYKYYSPASLKLLGSSCSAWLPASKACCVFEIRYRQWLGSPSSCHNQSEHGIKMANKPQGIKLWMACFEVGAEWWLWSLISLLGESCAWALKPGAGRARHPGCFSGKTNPASRNLDG